MRNKQNLYETKFVLTKKWSDFYLPTASSPVYIMLTQPSRDDNTNKDISALPRSSKLYFRLTHTLPGIDKQSVLFFTCLMLMPSQ